MEIHDARVGDIVVLAPDGSLAGTEEASLFESALSAQHQAGTRKLVVDFAGVGQLTGQAIRALLLVSRKLARTGGRIVLFGMNAKVRRAFTISGFDKDFAIVDTREQALRRMAEAPPPVAVPAVQPPQPPRPAAKSPASSPSPAAKDPREALVEALARALGVHAAPPAAVRPGDPPDGLVRLADALASALGANRR